VFKQAQQLLGDIGLLNFESFLSALYMRVENIKNSNFHDTLIFIFFPGGEEGGIFYMA
jgi:hypothetical protein